MKLIGGLLLIMFLLIACDPFQLVYVKNYTAEPISIHVYLNQRYSYIRPTEINSIDSLIENKKTLFDTRFNQKLIITTINDSLYQVILPKCSTTLLEPINIGFPIQKISVDSDIIHGSIVFSGSNHNIKQLKKQKRLQKASMSTYIVDFGKK